MLCDEEISQHIRDNFLVWGADVTQPDGFECQNMFQVSKSLLFVSSSSRNHFESQVGGFPYVGVYLHAGANKVQCVWSHEGYMSKEELLQGLQSAVTHGKPVVLQQRVAEETRQADRRLREEQEAMYQETMMQDMQRQAAAEAAEQKENLMDALKLSRQMVSRMRLPQPCPSCTPFVRPARRIFGAPLLLSQAKDEEMAAARARVEACPEPPAPDGKGVGADGQLVSSIRLQFPDGTKVQRRFPATSSVRLVRDYALVLMAEVHGTAPDDVELTASYPRRTFGSEDYGLTLQEAGWHPRVALFATGIEHSDEAELEGEAHRAAGGGSD